jgi:hypothetical protein
MEADENEAHTLGWASETRSRHVGAGSLQAKLILVRFPYT